MPTNVIIIGALGRMGREIGRIVHGDDAVRIAGAVERADHPETGEDYGSLMGFGEMGVRVENTIDSGTAGGAVAVSFTTAETLDSVLDQVRASPLPIVVGTTALSAAQHSRVADLARRVPVVCSPNMSLGVNLLFALTEIAARRLKDEFDIEIVEAHHRHKKDSPSGTARKLGEIAASALGREYDSAVRHGRHGSGTERTTGEIGMHAVRGGEIVGDHTVLFAGAAERLELRHSAQNRSTFARGAVAAAKWVAEKEPGLYSMKDVLEL